MMQSREAIAMGIDKESFVNVLLNGYGYVATGAFPDTVDFGGSTLHAKTYDPEGQQKRFWRQQAGRTAMEMASVKKMDRS